MVLQRLPERVVKKLQGYSRILHDWNVLWDDVLSGIGQYKIKDSPFGPEFARIVKCDEQGNAVEVKEIISPVCFVDHFLGLLAEEHLFYYLLTGSSDGCPLYVGEVRLSGYNYETEGEPVPWQD